VEGQLLAAYQVERLPDEALGRITRRPAASSRPRVLAVAAAIAFIVVGLAFVRSQRPDGAQTAAVAASPASKGRDTSGANLPYQRSNDGTVASITSRYQYLSPFDEMRCGRATPRRVVRTTCKDPASNAFIGQLVRGSAGSDACDTRTIAAAEHRDRVACWWGKPDGAAGTGHTFLKNG
jgi:hypothetical protein